MFGTDQPSPYDVRFRIFGFPVRVNPFFWIIMALFGEHFFRSHGIVGLLIWITCAFASILLHELGHAFMIRFYGSPSAITLTGFGGYAENPYPPTSPWKRFIISFAGPAIQLLLVGILWGSNELTNWAFFAPQMIQLMFTILVLINLFWAILNLLPIYPLDGGRMLREVFQIGRLRNPDSAIHITSMIVSGLLILRGVTSFMQIEIKIIDDILPIWLRPTLFMTIWLVMFFIMNYQLLQIANRRRRYYSDPYDDDTPPWQR